MSSNLIILNAKRKKHDMSKGIHCCSFYNSEQLKDKEKTRECGLGTSMDRNFIIIKMNVLKEI